MKRKLTRPLIWVALGCAAIVCVTSSPANAAVDVDVRGGAYADSRGPFVGGGVIAPIGQSTQWFLNPNAEAAFGDRRDVLSANFDVHYDLPTNTSWTVWVGAGPALIDRNNDSTSHGNGLDLGANMLVGAGPRKGDYRPFVQSKVTFSDDTELVLAAGVRF